MTRPNHEQLSPWLFQVLSDAREAAGGAEESAPQRFVRLCRRTAADVPAVAAQLRQQRRRTGFAPAPLGDYLEDLARECGVRLEPLLRWFHSPNLARPDLAEASALAGLGRALGFTAEEVMRHIRLAFAQSRGRPLPSPAAARSLGGEDDPLRECDEHLRSVEAAYEPQDQQELQRLERGVFAAY